MPRPRPSVPTERRILLGLLSLSATAPGLAMAAAATLASADRANIRRQGQAWVDSGPLPSLAVAVVAQGRLAFTEVFFHDGTPPAQEPVYQAASLSKPVFAFMVLELSRQGLLDLDAPMSSYFPAGYAHRQNLFALRQTPIVDLVPAQALRELTPRHLLSHTAALPNWADAAPLRPQVSNLGRWSYSGEGYVMLQRALEQRLGEPLPTLARRTVFEPLGMADTTFHTPPGDTARLASGHAASGAIRQLRFPPELALASGSLHTTATDFAKFLCGLLDRPDLLAQTLSQAVSLPRQPALRWGVGWGLDTTRGPNGTLWHWGNNPGYRSLALLSLDTRDAVVVLTNSELGMPAAKALAALVVPQAPAVLAFPLLQQ